MSKDYEELMRLLDEVPGVSEHLERVRKARGCGLCGGTGVISPTDDGVSDYVHFSTIDCDCVKENAE